MICDSTMLGNFLRSILISTVQYFCTGIPDLSEFLPMSPYSALISKLALSFTSHFWPYQLMKWSPSRLFLVTLK